MRRDKPYFIILGLIFLALLSLNDYIVTGDTIFLSLIGGSIINLVIIFTDYFDPLRIQEHPTVRNILEKAFSNPLEKLHNWSWAIIGIALGITGGGYPGLLIGLLFGLMIPEFSPPKFSSLRDLINSWISEVTENYREIHPLYFMVLVWGAIQFFRQFSRVSNMPELGLGLIESIAYISPISVSIGFIFYGMLKLTNYVFNSKKEYVIDTAQIFGILAYLHPLVFVLLLISGLKSSNSAIYTLKVMAILGPVMILPMWYILPYYKRDEKLDRNIQFLKAFQRNKGYSKEVLVQETGLSKIEVEEMLEIYSGNTIVNFRPLKIENGKYYRKEPEKFLMDFSN